MDFALGGVTVMHVWGCKMKIDFGLADEFLDGAGWFFVQTPKFWFYDGFDELGKDGAVCLDYFGSCALFEGLGMDVIRVATVYNNIYL